MATGMNAYKCDYRLRDITRTPITPGLFGYTVDGSLSTLSLTLLSTKARSMVSCNN